LHREDITGGFTARYGCTSLVYFELLSDMPSAIAREKQLNAGSRTRKIALIEASNLEWRDLYPEII
jgi:putative endonuclease